MKQEERELLLKDLSARLPYGVLCKVEFVGSVTDFTIPLRTDLLDEFIDYKCEVKPYLRPFSDITKDEFKYLDERGLTVGSVSSVAEIKTEFDMIEIIDFCNANHIDYRGLIPRDLALEAEEGMYKL